MSPDRFNGLSECRKPLKRFLLKLNYHTGLKPGANEMSGRWMQSVLMSGRLKICRAALSLTLWSALHTFAVPATSDVFVSGQEGYNTFRIPAVVATTNGTLLVFAEGRKRGGGDSGDIDLVLKRSTDGGRIWSKLQVVWDDAANTCGNPCTVVDRDTGDILLLTTWNRGDDHEHQIIAQTSRDTRRVFVSRSGDDGQTWSVPREITTDVKLTNWTWYATGPGAGIQLQRGAHKGRLVIPCDHIEAVTKRYFSHVIFSDDHGKTWRLGGSTPQDQVNECEVVELVDGALMLNMRSYDPARKARQTAISRDGGLTWSEQRIVPELIDPICQGSIRRAIWPAAEKPGLILFANAASTKREKLTVRASDDDGHTWPRAKELHAGPSAYSCLVALPSGDIGCFYEADGYRRMVFARFTLDWLLDGNSAPPPAKN